MLVALISSALAASLATPPPSWVSAHMTDNLLSLTDLSWAAPRFSESSDQRALWSSAMQWVAQRKHEQAARLNVELSASGAGKVGLADGCYDDDTCELLSELDDMAGRYGSLATLEAAAQQVAPYVDGFVAASRTAEHSLTADPDPTLPAQLHGTATADQILRIGLTGSDYARRNSPPMVAQAQDFIVLRTVIETNRMDSRHTAWLKDIVTRGGWPKASDVGATGAYDAWLLAQHADRDPVFQYQALQLMAPLINTGDADAKRYAYLYDRIMLQIAGHQKYGTQAMCQKGEIAPQPLEDASKVDSYRKEVGLPTLELYLQRFHQIAECDAAGLLRPKSHT